MASLDELLGRLSSPNGKMPDKPQSASRMSSEQPTNSLLNLLNIRAQAPSVPQRAASSFASTPADAHILPIRSISNASTPKEPASSTQNYLLNLLKDVKPVEQSTTSPIINTEDLRKTESTQHTPSTNRFAYVNPFDELHASSPLNSSQKPSPPVVTSKNGTIDGTPARSALSKDTSMKSTNTVAEKLAQVGDEVETQAAEALAQAEKSDNGAQERDADSWSTAEDLEAEQDDTVEVYSFPMRPFVMLKLDRSMRPRSFRRSTIERSTPVARLRKDFSHDDRSLAAATQDHIVYCVPPTDKKAAAGLKLIRQDDGQNKHLWADKKERLCNVQIIPGRDGEIVLATGLNGTIFHAVLKNDDFESTRPDSEGFSMPPPASDGPAQPTDIASVRTRAKLSNTEPGLLFAAARGATIHLLSPPLIADHVDLPTREVDTAAYVKAFSHKIEVGKACKDFCFSEDDTVIASLDKLGKVKFWDVQTVTDAIEDEQSQHVLSTPVHKLDQAAGIAKTDPKLSPSSITFLDKDRAHSKKVALRYVLVGFQQNQVLQLWDLGLGQCVQEVHLPGALSETEEAKGVCSVAFHPKSASIIIGHPGRNSVFIIHVSAPKYELNTTTQAAYLRALAQKDLRLAPRPESTAIMSGIREFSFAEVGQLRSLDVLRNPYQSEQGASEDDAVFEIYAMHSKGVLTIPISRQDLGWDAKGKNLKPINTIEKGLLVVSDLRLVAKSDEQDTSMDMSARSPALKSVSKKVEQVPSAVSKKVEQVVSAPATPSKKNVKPGESPKATKIAEVAAPSSKLVKSSSNLETTAPPVTSALSEGDAGLMVLPDQSSLPTITAEPGANTALSTAQLDQSASSNVEAKQSVISSTKHPDLPAGSTRKSQQILDPSTTTKQLSNGSTDVEDHFTQLYKRLDSDRRIQEAAGAAKQDAILRLVASTLSDNVESSLQRIIATNIQQVMPAIHQQMDQSIAKHVAATLPELLRQELAQALVPAVNDSMKSALVDAEVQKQYTTALSADIGKIVNAALTEHGANISKYHTQHEANLKHLAKGKDITDVVQRLEASESRITALLGAVQQEQVMLKEALEELRSRPVQAEAVEPKTVELTEAEQLRKLFDEGQHEQATIDWLQSPHQAELFDNLFVNIDPAYLDKVSSLVGLSVSAAVTASLETNIEKRLEWLGSVINNVNLSDKEISEVAPKIFDVLVQRLQGTYMQLSEMEPTDQAVLRKLASLARQIVNLRKTVG